MPVLLEQRVVNLKELEREFNKTVPAINRALNSEFLSYSKRVTLEIQSIVRNDLLKYNYSGNAIDKILKGLSVKTSTSKGNKVFARVTISVNGRLARIHLGEHKERFTQDGLSRGTLKPDRLNLANICRRDEPKIQEIAERVTKKVLELKRVR